MADGTLAVIGNRDLFGTLPTKEMQRLIIKHHYTKSIPSGKCHYFEFEDAIIAFSIPANPYVSKFLTGRNNAVWELSRLWAPDGHRRNLLSQAIAFGVTELRRLVPGCLAVISYADPAVGHMGTVYRAASWIYLGQCEETRAYRSPGGLLVARRKFHSGNRAMLKAEIEAAGFIEERHVGKHRFARGFTARVRKRILTLDGRAGGGSI